MDLNEYVGLPYVRGGRDRSGIDCWGLVRLVHAEQYGNELPSFADAYDLATERDRLAELIAQQKEAWHPVAEPRAGDVIVLRIEGAESHLGLVVEPGRMLHALSGAGSVIEPYASAKWAHRISGFFRYAPGAPVTISAKPHPLRSTRIDDTLPHGASVQAMVDHYTRACGWPADVPVRGVAFVDGSPVPQAEWSACVPAPGSRVEFRVVAGDGDVGRIVAMIAIAVFAQWAAPYLVSSMVGINGAAVLGSTGLGIVTGVAQGAIVVAGSMLVNAIFPVRPPESGAMTQIKPAWALSGGQNQMAPYGAIPVVLGRYRFTGLLGTTPWLEQGGEETYLRQTVVWGYAPLQVSEINVGLTPIGSLEEVQVETSAGTTEPTEDFWRLAGSDTSYQSINIKLEHTGAPGVDSPDDWIERRTADDADTIAVMLSWPQGLAAIQKNGKRGGWYSVVQVQIRQVGAADWTEVEGAFFNGDYRDPFNKQLSYAVARGQYDVRCRVTSETENVYGGTFLASVILVGIRSHRHQRPIQPVRPLAMTALRVRASNQVNGQLEGVSALVESICLDWTGSAWIERATRNPASLYRYVLQHPANARARPDSEIDLAALQDWHDWCAARGLIFDHVLTGRRPLLDVLRDICAAGRASPGMIDGKWTVTIDREKPVIAQHFTPHNSWGFEGARLLPKVPHALRVTFVNAGVDYQPDERIVYDDGYSAANATEIESIELPGVSESAAVYRLARHHLAQIKLRPEEYALNADIEHVVCNRGDRVKVTHDVPMWGLGSGRIKTYVDATHIETDEPFPMDAGVQYTVRIRLEDGSSITRTVAAVAEDGYYTTIALTASITEAEGRPGNLCLFGALNSESVDCLVKSIEPAENHSARLILVDYAPAVFTADTEAIPPWSSQITQPPVLARRLVSEVPTITDVISDERVLVKVGPRTFQANIQVSWAQPGDLVAQGLHVETQMRRVDVVTIPNEVVSVAQDPSPWGNYGLAPISAGGALIGPVQELAQYDIRCRFVSPDGLTGEWVTAATGHTVIGKTTPPAPVDRFKVIEQPGGIKQYLWQINEPPNDLLAFEIAYSYGTVERPWAQMIPLAAKDPIARIHETNEPINDGAYTFAIRVVDAGELASAPVYYTEVLDGDQFGNPVAVVVPHELDWPGTKTNCGIEGTSLVHDGALTWNDLDVEWGSIDRGWHSDQGKPWSAYATTWSGAGAWYEISDEQFISYEHTAIDMGSVATWIIRANALVGGTLTLEISTSDDGITYSPWAPPPSSAITTRYIKFAVTVSGALPIIYRAQIIIYGA